MKTFRTAVVCLGLASTARPAGALCPGANPDDGSPEPRAHRTVHGRMP